MTDVKNTDDKKTQENLSNDILNEKELDKVAGGIGNSETVANQERKIGVTKGK